MTASNLGQAAVSSMNRTAGGAKYGSGNKAKKKALNYNPREISSQIVRASKSRSASVVLVRAKSKVGVLARCLGTGQYDDGEVRAAIAHAKRVVRCAQLKVNNLKEEERLKKRNDKEQEVGRKQKKNEIKRRTHQKEQALKTKIALKETQQVLKEKTRKQELMQKRRLHRNEENGKLIEADMKYMEEQSNAGNNTGAYAGGVSMDLSLQAMILSEIRLSEHALELLEQQAVQEMGADMGSGTADGVSGADAGVSQTASAAGVSSVGASVDLML